MIRACSILLMAMAFLSASDSQQPQSTQPAQQAPAPAPANPPTITLAADSKPVIDALAAKLAVEIANRHFSTVAVFGAMGADNVRSSLGLSVGDAFSDSLARQAKTFRVIDRNALRAELKKQDVAEAMVGSNVFALWIYQQVKADCVVMVKLEDYDSSSVSVAFYLFDPPKMGAVSLANGKALLALSPPQTDSLQRAIDLATRGDGKIFDVAASLPSAGVPAGENGVGYPNCLHCPRPDYSLEARKLKVQGDVWMTVVVTARGDPIDIDITKGLGHGLDEKAAEAVRGWKFKPALDSSGNAVAAKTVVQVQFWLQ
jgi:TonB family protein